MKPIDKHYLSLQFQLKIYSKNATEFQSFFESIMEKALRGFQRIRPYGNLGDAGNDGYKADTGLYFQVYAPNTPKVNEAEAAKKLGDDFGKLYEGWNHIAEIKQYNFVFNDKYGGSVQLLEEAISALKAQHPAIEFRLLLAKDLEALFFELPEEDILSLGFDIDRRQAIANAHSYLEGVSAALDREDCANAARQLEQVREILVSLADTSLYLEQELLECRSQQKLERIDEARQHYLNLIKRFPTDPRPLLYLAEIYLNDGDLDKNAELLEQASAIERDYWLLHLQQLRRKMALGETINTEALDENAFPAEPRIRADYYRAYAVTLALAGDHATAGRFIANALHLDPLRFANHREELSTIEIRMHLSREPSERAQLAKDLLHGIEGVENKFASAVDIGPRNKAILLLKRLNAELVQGRTWQVGPIAERALKLLMQCHSDMQTEHLLALVVRWVILPDTSLRHLTEFLRASGRRPADALYKELVTQFSFRGTLLTDGRTFFRDLGHEDISQLIEDLAAKNYENVLNRLDKDIPFAVGLANTLQGFPDLRRMIIERLPGDKELQKDKLLMLLSFEEKEFDRAFEILKTLDLSSLDYIECRPMLQIAQEKKAWDLEIVVLNKLLEKETRDPEIFNLELQLLEAVLNLGKFAEAMELGENLLDKDRTRHFLGPVNNEALLTNTLVAGLERGKVDPEALKRAKAVLDKHRPSAPSYEFKKGIEAEIQLSNGDADQALRSVIEGVKIKKALTPQDYAGLYVILAVKLTNALDLKLDSLERVRDESFVKLKGREQWYFVGDGCNLDAVQVLPTSERYALFLGKETNDEIVMESKYGPEKAAVVIEKVFSIEQYVLWQTVRNFQQLAEAGDLEWVQLISVPATEGGIDLQHVIEFFGDIEAKRGPVFDMYCKGQIPLAMLAVSEGGLTNAISRIVGENRGFIHGTVGTTEELEQQRAVARKLVMEKSPFYLDGTSALFFAEAGLLPGILEHFPNVKVPQSVINMLAAISARFTYSMGEVGRLGYAAGKIRVETIDHEKSNRIRANLGASIRALESKPENIGSISLAAKVDCFSERRIPAELSDACILAQREGLPVLTDDFLILKLNEVETKKEPPGYCSSFVLVRTLYEAGLVGFGEYLDYFGYLSSYRFRFLSLDAGDIEKAAFGDGQVKVVKPDSIRKLNLPLTLAEEYGVSLRTAFSVVGHFLMKILTDDAITLELGRQVFIELIEAFPTAMSKQELGQSLLIACVKAVESRGARAVARAQTPLHYSKVDELMQVAQLYGSRAKLWTLK